MADNDFLPVYLIVGADELKREFVFGRLNERMAKLGDLDFNKDVFDGGALTPDEITGACNTLPFMSEKRLVVIQGAERLKKAASEAIVSYLENPNDTTVLALIAGEARQEHAPVQGDCQGRQEGRYRLRAA